MLRAAAWTIVFLVDGRGAPRPRPIAALALLVAAAAVMAWAFPAVLAIRP